MSARDLLKTILQTGLKLTTHKAREFCECRVLGKTTTVPFPNRTTKPDDILDVVDGDLITLDQPTREGYRYALPMRQRKGGLSLLYLMAKKDNTVEHLCLQPLAEFHLPSHETPFDIAYNNRTIPTCLHLGAALIDQKQRRILDSKVRVAALLGYEHQGYELLNRDIWRIITSISVVFNETDDEDGPHESDEYGPPSDSRSSARSPPLVKLTKVVLARDIPLPLTCQEAMRSPFAKE
ncbi:hypothetical protein BJ742DRAFT_738916 [Cladochytrium replicatum]|nr:hypothetical protein BJ742DRAFT_738916 [Cladochytrium replicatum]